MQTSDALVLTNPHRGHFRGTIFSSRMFASFVLPVTRWDSVTVFRSDIFSMLSLSSLFISKASYQNIVVSGLNTLMIIPPVMCVLLALHDLPYQVDEEGNDTVGQDCREEGLSGKNVFHLRRHHHYTRNEWTNTTLIGVTILLAFRHEGRTGIRSLENDSVLLAWKNF